MSDPNTIATPRWVEKPRRRLTGVKLYSNRQKRRSRASPRQIVSLRLRDFAILFRSRYGVTLPDDDSGRDDIEPVIHHLASLPQPSRRAQYWLETWAPWITLGEKREIIAKGIASARAWTADQLAWRYRVTKEERTVLGLTTIGAIDFGKAARTKRRKERDRLRKERKRRDREQKPRAEYLAEKSISRRKPWKIEGISRASWYRRQVRETETGPATP